VEVTPYGFVNFYDKFYQNHGVILIKPITDVQELVKKALKELGDYHQSRDFIDRLTAKLVGQELPTNSDQLTFLFEKLIKEVKAEIIIETNLQETLGPGFFQQAIHMTVEFAKDHPYIFGAACIATAAAAGYFLYPYVKTLLGIGGSAVAGSSTGNSSANNLTIPHGNLRVPTSAVIPANEEIRRDVLTQLRLHSDTATSYATDAANMARNIADKPELESMAECEELLEQLKPIEKKY
jgi:hypothetical protein